MDYTQYDPQRYAPDRETALRQGRQTLRAIGPLLGPLAGQSILEIGCGCGSLLLALREAGCTACRGVDASADLARHGRERLAVDITVGLWRPYLEQSSELFDAILALDVLEHLPREELHATLVATRARLKPGGKLVLGVPNALCPFALAVMYGDLTHNFLVTPRVLEHSLRRAGFAGPVRILETRPSQPLKRLVFEVIHRLVVKPAVGLAYYHFRGEFPTHLTPGLWCAAGTESQK